MPATRGPCCEPSVIPDCVEYYLPSVRSVSPSNSPIRVSHEYSSADHASTRITSVSKKRWIERYDSMLTRQSSFTIELDFIGKYFLFPFYFDRSTKRESRGSREIEAYAKSEISSRRMATEGNARQHVEREPSIPYLARSCRANTVISPGRFTAHGLHSFHRSASLSDDVIPAQGVRGINHRLLFLRSATRHRVRSAERTRRASFVDVIYRRCSKDFFAASFETSIALRGAPASARATER